MLRYHKCGSKMSKWQWPNFIKLKQNFIIVYAHISTFQFICYHQQTPGTQGKLWVSRFFEIEEGFRATQKSVPLAHRISKICTECAAMYSNVQNGNVQELLHVACIINFSDCSAQLLWCRLGYGFQEFVKFISHLMLMKLTHWSILILCVTTSTLW